MDLAAKAPFAGLERLIESVPPQRRRLGVWVGLSLAAHGMAFWMITVQYPILHMPEISPAKVMLAGSRPDNGMPDQAAEWDQWQDSRQFLIPQGPLVKDDENQMTPDPFLGESAESPAALLALTGEVDFLDLGLPNLSVRALDGLQPAPQRFAPAVLVPEKSHWKTMVVWDPVLKARLSPDAQTLALSSPKADLIDEAGVTVLDVALSPSGQAIHVLVRESSGRSTTDSEAVDALRRSAFLPGEDREKMVWGRVTVFWNFTEDDAAGTGAKP